MRPRSSTLVLSLLAALAVPAVNAETKDVKAQLVEQGQYWQARANAERASEIWLKVLRLDPNQINALYGMGLIGVKQNKPQQAQQYLARLQALSPRPWLSRQLEQDIALAKPSNKALLDEARRLADANERDKATDVFRKMFNGLTPEGTIGREYYNNLAFNPAGWAEARQGMERLLRETPDDAILALFYGKQLIRHEESRAEGARVLARLTKRVEIAGDADESWRLALVWMGPPNAAQSPLFEEFLKVHPQDQEIRDQLAKGRQRQASAAGTAWQPDPLVAAGLQALDKGDQDAAEKAFQARLESHPDDPDALGGLGVVRQQQNRFSEAQQLLNSAIRKGGTKWKAALDSVRYWALLQQARDLQTEGQTARATSVVNEAMRLNPTSVDGRLTLADIQAQAGQYDAATANYRQVLATDPGNAQAVRGLVNVLSQTGQAEEALRMLDSLSETEQSKFGDAGRLRSLRSIQLAGIAEQGGDIAAAQAAMQDAIKNDPENVWTRFKLARLYVKSGDTKKARDLTDSFVKTHPDNADALYTSALLSVELEQWSDAQTMLDRIPAERRTSDMNNLADQVALTIQVNLASAAAKRGQKQQALILLDRAQPLAGNNAERTATLAAAYVDAGDTERAQAMMRALLSQSSTPSPDLTLQYASILLKTGDDVQVHSILSNLQKQPMGAATRKRYDDLLFAYRVRQADRLREGGDLAAAYDTLAPALVQRPGDVTATSALARMYTTNGDNLKAFELYKPLLQRNPKDPAVLLNAADAAVVVRDIDYAENALDRFVKLQSDDPTSLTEAARIYRAMGKTREATELLRKAVAIEQSEKQRSVNTQASSLGVGPNPFAAQSGYRNQIARTSASAIPPPAETVLSSSSTPAVAPVDTYRSQRSGIPPVAVGYVPPPAASSQRSSIGQVNPFAAEIKPQSASAAADSTTPAQRALNDILQTRSGYVNQGLSIRSNNSESGLSKLTDVETPLEVSVPAGDGRVLLRVTPVSLDAGSVGTDESASRFGNGAASAARIGSQRDSGIGLGVAYAGTDSGLTADIGTTPLGFQYTTAVGGVSVQRPLDGNTNAHYGISLSRRAVTDSVTSFAGTTDQRDGRSWGGVTANGIRAELGFDDSDVGVYGYGSLHKLLGHNVESNTRVEVGGGVYKYLQNTTDNTLTAGLSATVFGYENNQDFFTYGHGGYFSPQSYFAVGVPVTWQQRNDRFTYQLKGSLGIQSFQQDAVDYFPNDKALQATDGRRYADQSKSGLGYSLEATGEYKFGPKLFVGGTLGLNNASDYKQYNVGMYVRYTFEDMTGSPMTMPLSPYRSPYSN